MAHVSVENGSVEIQLSTMDKVWAVHGSLTIPLDHLTRVYVEDENGWEHMWRKLAGTNAPGLKMAGTFFFPGGLAFLDYGSGTGCLVLETNHETYTKVIVQLDDDQDPKAIAAGLSQHIGKGSTV